MSHAVSLPTDAARMAPLGRLPIVAAAYLATVGGGAWLWLVMSGATHGVFEAAVCAAPAVVACALGFTSQADRQQYVVRLLACALMLPILLMMWAGSQDAPEATPEASLLVRQPWLFFIGFALLHVVAFLAAVAWLAAAVTRVEAAAACTPVPGALLVQRLKSLATAGVPFDVSSGADPSECVVTLRTGDADRTHRVLLQIDERTHTVRVRERLGASGAAPRNADARSMRGIGAAAIDPTRPDAQRISSRVAQTSMIDPARLQAMRLVLRDGDAEPPTQALATTDPDELVTLMCALVTRSGYAWQPLLRFGRR